VLVILENAVNVHTLLRTDADRMTRLTRQRSMPGPMSTMFAPAKARSFERTSIYSALRKTWFRASWRRVF